MKKVVILTIVAFVVIGLGLLVWRSGFRFASYPEKESLIRLLEGIELVDEKIAVGDRTVRFRFAVFREDEFEFKIIDNGADRHSPIYSNLKEGLRKHNCVLGANGGFFDNRSFEPQGLMVAEGKTTGAFDPKSWMKGVLMVKESNVNLFELQKVPSFEGASAFIQSGPWLVKNGQSESGFTNDSRPRRRTFVGHDGNGRWILGSCVSATLHEISELLFHENIKSVIELKYVLNLDGGPSTGFYCMRNGIDLYVKEGWAVRNFLGVGPKQDAEVSMRE